MTALFVQFYPKSPSCYFFLLPLLLVSSVTSAQEEKTEAFKVKYENKTDYLGIGLLKLNYHKYPRVDVFMDPELTLRYDELRDGGANMEIYPKFYELDYGIYDFVCLEITEAYYKIEAGASGIKYVKASEAWTFTSWQDLIERSFGVSRKAAWRGTNPLRSEKSEDSPEVPFEPKRFDQFCVIRLEGDWIKVKYDCLYGTDEFDAFGGQPCANYIDKCEEGKTGWIRWRYGSDLLIQIFLRP